MKRNRPRMVFFAAALLGGGCTGTIGSVNSGSGGSSSTTGSGGAGNTVATGTGGAGNMVSTGSGGSSVVITGAAGGGVSSADTRGIAITSQVPRLTNAQYDRVVAIRT